MLQLYKRPKHVYLVLGVLAIIGAWCGLNMPMALFPNASRPIVAISLPYGHLTAPIFRNRYGSTLEDNLRRINQDGATSTKVEATYGAERVLITSTFSWGDRSEAALREACALFNTTKSQLDFELTRAAFCHPWTQNGGILAVSFFSNQRDAKELYRILKPILASGLAAVKDAETAALFQPAEESMTVTVDPYRLAAAGLYPADVTASIRQALKGVPVGGLTIDGRRLELEMPQKLQDLDGLRSLPVLTPAGAKLPLHAVASVDMQPLSQGTTLFHTNGKPSLLLFAAPKPGGNVKKMAEDILAVIERSKSTMPSDVQFKVLVDPSVFIGDAIVNVVREVLVGSLLAVFVLFLFIGNLRNVATAAVEIPLSMVLALIAMKLSGVSLNLISLGGLALSAGMNVDGSVVVMETIFRRFHAVRAGEFDETPFQSVVAAVREIAPALLMSTLASIVVFLPLIFTSDLSYALLGDLAKAVVYSHGASALVALVLVPTVRLHILDRNSSLEKPAPLERLLSVLESQIERFHRGLARLRLAKFVVLLVAFAVLPALAGGILPRLPRELIGTPEYGLGLCVRDGAAKH